MLNNADGKLENNIIRIMSATQKPDKSGNVAEDLITELVELVKDEAD